MQLNEQMRGLRLWVILNGGWFMNTDKMPIDDKFSGDFNGIVIFLCLVGISDLTVLKRCHCPLGIIFFSLRFCFHVCRNWYSMVLIVDLLRRVHLTVHNYFWYFANHPTISNSKSWRFVNCFSYNISMTWITTHTCIKFLVSPWWQQ